MRKILFSRDVHVETSFLLTMAAILFSFNANATCTPTPDCASIGYTETSCEGDSLKCPFDISKLYCIPCDSSFKYTCSGDNITGGIGSACGGKYVACECSADSVYKNGECICDTSCKVGAIYYSDGTCSACVDSNKTAIGVVVKSNELVMSKKLTAATWGTKGIDIPDLSNLSDAKADYNGKSNTAILVAFQTTEGLTASNSPAITCYEYSTDGTNAGDWYLPAFGELYSYVCRTNYSKINTTMDKLRWSYGKNYFWSSSERSDNDAWGAYSDGCDTSNPSKLANKSVSCFLAIN